MSLFIGLNTSLTSLRAAQTGIDTAAHNISNAATPGYTRQRLELAATIPFNSPDGPIGTGVGIDRINRLRDQFLDARVRSTSAEFARSDTLADLLGRAELVTGEPDNGISTTLTGLWNSLEDLALDPNGPAVRRQVITQIDGLASKIRSTASAWNQLATDTTAQRDVSLADVNGQLSRIAEINRAVANADPTRVSNDLLDERDLLADQVSEQTGATATLQPDGTLSIQLGAVSLVTGDVPSALAVNGTGIEVLGVPVTANLSGEIDALHEFVTTTIPNLLANLNQFAADLATALNTQHAAGYRDDGTPGGPLLSVTAGSEASTIQAVVTAGSDLAPAGSLDPITLLPAALDGTNAQLLSDLRTTGVFGGGTLDSRLNEVIIDVGSQVAFAEATARAHGDLAVSAEVARQSQHGVSLDEEMVDVVRFQRQLEAASRVMSAIDEALDVLVNRTGIVGR